MDWRLDVPGSQRGTIHVPSLPTCLLQCSDHIVSSSGMDGKGIHQNQRITIQGRSLGIHHAYRQPKLSQAARTPLFRLVTSSIIMSSILVSISRILALSHYYHAPLDLAFHFESIELPRLLNATGLLGIPVTRKEEAPRIDLSPINQFGLRLCLGKEWYRFPGHYLIPDGVDVQFIKSDFNGLLPRHFDTSTGRGRFWKRDATRNVPSGLNDLNKEERSHHVG